MNQTTQQEQGSTPAKSSARSDWEWFWRIIAGLMLLLIAWVAWVLYQLSPRSVVTPLAYSNQIRPVGTQPPAAVATAPAAAAAAPPAPQPAASSAAADLAMGIAQAAARAGAHQSSADVQAAAMEKKEGQIKGEGLRLATEIAMPPAENQGLSAQGKAGGAVPAATGLAGKDRP